MANRVFKFIRSKRRKTAIQHIHGAPSICSFCGGSLSLSALNASSLANNETGTGPLAVICAHCIFRLEPLCRLMDWYQKFFRREDGLWRELFRTIRDRLDSEDGSLETKKTVTDILLRLLQRSFAVIAGFKANGLSDCPVTGVPLSAPRIAIIRAADPAYCVIELIVAGAAAVGLPVVVASGLDAPHDTAIQALKTNCCNGDPVLAAIGLLVLDEYHSMPADIGVVYVLASPAGLPGNVEIVRVPDF